MTHFLANDANPEGYKIEDLLFRLRSDLVERMGKICDDRRDEAHQVFVNDVAILRHLTEAIKLAEDNTQILDKAFGRSKPGKPRIGNA